MEKIFKWLNAEDIRSITARYYVAFWRRTTLFVFTVLAAIMLMGAEVSKYTEGWEDGYCSGWRMVKGQEVVCPVAPPAPVPKASCPEGYRCGYDRGFVAGKKKAKE